MASPDERLERLVAAVREGHASGDGIFTRRCHAALEGHLPGSRVLLTTSCTHALEMSALLLDLGPRVGERTRAAMAQVAKAVREEFLRTASISVHDAPHRRSR